MIVEDDDHSVFLAGDSAYTQDLMLRGVVDGVGTDPAAELRTHAQIRSYAAAQPTVYLVAHDPGVTARLAERQALPRPRLERAA